MKSAKCLFSSLFCLVLLAACSEDPAKVKVSWDEVKLTTELAVAQNPQSSAELRSIAERMRMELDAAEFGSLKALNRELLEGEHALATRSVRGLGAFFLAYRLTNGIRHDINSVYQQAFDRLGFLTMLDAENRIEMYQGGRSYLFDGRGYAFSLTDLTPRDPDLYVDVPALLANRYGRRPEWLLFPNGQPTSIVKNKLELFVRIEGSLGNSFYVVKPQDADTFRTATGQFLQTQLGALGMPVDGTAVFSSRDTVGLGVTVPSLQRPVSP